MKTTIELRDELFNAAKRRARQQGVSLRSLLESALETRLAQPLQRPHKRIKLKVFDKPQLAEGAKGLPWERLRDLIYAEREAKATHGGT